MEPRPTSERSTNPSSKKGIKSALMRGVRHAFGIGDPVIQVVEDLPENELAEVKHETFTQFDNIAEAYFEASWGKDKGRGLIENPATERIIGKFVKPGDRCLDLGSGAIPFASRTLLAGAKDLTAIDASRKLLELGLNALPKEMRGTVNIFQGDVTIPFNNEELGIGPDQIDFASCFLATMYFTDEQFEQTFKNVASVLKPNHFFITSVSNSEIAPTILDHENDGKLRVLRKMDMHYGDTEAPTTNMPRLDARAIELAAKCGFELVEIVPMKPNLDYFLNCRRPDDFAMGVAALVNPLYKFMVWRKVDGFVEEAA